MRCCIASAAIVLTCWSSLGMADAVPPEHGQGIQTKKASRAASLLRKKAAGKLESEVDSHQPKSENWFKVFDRDWDAAAYQPYVSEPQQQLRDARWFENDGDEWDGWHMYGENHVETDRSWAYWHRNGRYGSGQHDGVHTRPMCWGDCAQEAKRREPLFVRWWLDIFPPAEMRGAANSRSVSGLWIASAAVAMLLQAIHLR
mmetsp:Transcript_75878/g.180297  ORF Transcript_75878/g.180297 Transcript_75878/m.180297 type:complete len:201 (-) Transcript_75878:51-653(-)